MVDRAGRRYIPNVVRHLLIGAEVVGAVVLILWLVMGVNLVALVVLPTVAGRASKRPANWASTPAKTNVKTTARIPAHFRFPILRQDSGQVLDLISVIGLLYPLAPVHSAESLVRSASPLSD